VLKSPAPGNGREDIAGWIVAIATRRDLDLFAALFVAFAPKVKAYLMRRGMSAEQAEELAQETLLAIWRNAGRFDPSRGSAQAWIFTIARNLSIDFQRREHHPDTLTAQAFGDEAEDATPEEAYAALELAEQMREALALLPPEQRDVLQMVFFGDRPHAEVARALNLPLGTVKGRLRLAVVRLRAMLDPER
jgi:RNA polymerase sigma factor (sigma-70 family)